MRTLPLAILGALIGGVYEAYATFESMRTGAHSLGQGIAIVLAGAVVGAIDFAAAAIAYRMYASRRNESANRR